jgi:hypothetical protein
MLGEANDVFVSKRLLLNESEGLLNVRLNKEIFQFSLVTVLIIKLMLGAEPEIFQFIWTLNTMTLFP